jgi:hypothetical protein
MVRSGYLKMVLAVLLLILNGCMMAAMHGGSHGDQAHAEHGDAVKTVKEVRVNNLAASFDVPPLIKGEVSLIKVTINDIADKKPVTGLKLGVVIQPIKMEHPSGSAMMGHDKGHDMNNHQTSIEGSITEDKGTYYIKHIFNESGKYNIALTADPNIIKMEGVSIDVTVSEPKEKSSSSTLWYILGGVGMGAMMLLMMGGMMF